MNMLWKRSQFVFIASLCLLLLGLNVKASDKPGAAATRAEVVWSESEGGKSRIYYSALIGPGWTDKVALPDSGGNDITPCIARTDDGVSWVVWVVEGVDGTRLFYVYSKGGTWSEAKEIPTDLSLNMAPSIAVIEVDKEDRPVIVWAGRDDKQENHIFFSRWNGMDWEEASRVDRDDLTLCITPLIGTKSNGALSVSWYGLDGTFYKPYCSEWYYDKSEKAWRWSDEIESDTDNLFKVQIDRGKKGEIPKLPEFIPEPLTAGLYVTAPGRLKHIAMRYFQLEWLIEKGSPSNRIVTEGVQFTPGSDILAFGDSITQGVPYVDAHGEGRRWIGGYEPRLDSLLNSPVYNWGWAGEATPQGLNRLQLEVLTHPADYVLIMEGLNDRWVVPELTYDDTKNNLRLMIDACWGKGVTPILATLTPDGRPDATYANDGEIVNQYNPRIRALASEKGVALADQHAKLRPNWDFLSWSPVDGKTVDWFHPHMDGYNAMAGVWYMAITGQTMVPTVTTYSISSITATSASGGGYVTLDGGASVTARGVCWSTTANPTTANSKTTNGSGTGSFPSSITGLNPLTTYHVRAYAKNSVGTAYGSDVTFTTSGSLPTVTTTSVSSITSTSASSGGNVTSDGGSFVTARGVCWSTTANPTTANSKTTDGSGTGSFASSITGLDPLKTYHVRAYATNSVGTAYGSDVTFETTCDGGAIVIQNKTFAGGTTTTCNCTESITIGPGVIIEENAEVTLKAPIVRGVPNLTIEAGAKVTMTQ